MSNMIDYLPDLDQLVNAILTTSTRTKLAIDHLTMEVSEIVYRWNEEIRGIWGME